MGQRQGISQHRGGGGELLANFRKEDEGWAVHAKNTAQGTATQVWVSADRIPVPAREAVSPTEAD